MSFDRAKTLQSAQKHLAKGNLDKAVVDYERVVQADPKDARSLLKLGDIYTRKGSTKDAGRTYRKVAELYAEEGFFLKAVAVYKQILKLDPDSLDTWEKLAEMYELLSLVSDALAAHDHIAEAYLRAGQTRKAVDSMGRMVDLDPENVAACIKYAEALSKCNLVDEAADAFRRGAELLKTQGRIEDYIKVAERLLYHSPEDHDLARELSLRYLERGDARHALAKLQSCFKADPHNTETLTLLARSFEALGQTQKSVAVYKELARVHEERAETAQRVQAMRAVLALDPNDAEAQQVVSELGSMPATAPLRTDEPAGVDVPNDDDDLILVDEDEEDPSGVINLADSGARPMPDEEDDIIIVGDDGDDPEDGDVHDVTTGEFRIESEHPPAPSSGDDSVTAILPTSDDDGLHEAFEDDEEDDDDDIVIIDDDDEDDDGDIVVDEAPETVAAAPDAGSVQDELFGADAPEDTFVIDEDDDDDGPELVIEDVGADDEALFAEAEEVERLSMRPPEHPAAPPAPVAPPPAPPAAFSMPPMPSRPATPPSVSLSPTPAADAPPAGVPSPPPEAAPPKPAPASLPPQDDEDDEDLPEEIADAIEEADFYLQQGLTDEALESLSDALDSFPGHAALLAKIRKVNGESEPAPTAPQTTPPPGAGDADGEDGDDDAAFEMAARLADESPTGKRAAATADTGQVEVSDVISQFRDGVAKAVDAKDTATRYDLGIAYMEMGLHAEAIEEFKLCLDDPTRLCQIQTMIGLAYVASNDPQTAVQHFEAALGAGPTEAGQLELWFELGNAYEFLGRDSDALIHYQKVEEIDPSYRDVAARVERLGTQVSQDDEDQEFDEMFDNLILKD